MYYQDRLTPESYWHPVGPTPPQYLVRPYQADIPSVMDTVAQTSTMVDNSIVKAKHQGSTIKTAFLPTLTDHVDDANNIPSPSDSPLKAQILFPAQDLETKQKSSDTARIETLENEVSTLKHEVSDLKHEVSHLKNTVHQLDQKMDHVLHQLALLISALPQPNVQVLDSTISAQPSETPPVSENPTVLPQTPKICVPCAWNGTNSQIKEAPFLSIKEAPSVSPPIPPTTNPSVTVTVRPITTPSLKALGPPPRPKVTHAHTSDTSSTCPRRGALQPVSNPSRVAEGEPKTALLPDRRNSRRSSNSWRN